MGGLVICSREGLMYGRRYLWHGDDMLVIEGRLSDEEQLAAVEEALAEARERHVGAVSPAA